MAARIDEIAPDLYRICLYVPAFDLQFNHCLVRDDEPSLFHTGMPGMFPAAPSQGSSRVHQVDQTQTKTE